MKRLTAILFSVSCLALLGGSSVAAVIDINLAPQASGYGTFLPLAQGTASGVADGWTYSFWNQAVVGPNGYTSPTTAGGVDSNDVYMTWSSARNVRNLRVLSELAVLYSGVEVFTLNAGGTPSNINDWTQVLVNTALSAGELNIDLGQTYNTEGLRVKVTRGSGDARTPIGEIAVFEPLGLAGGYDSARIAPTSVEGSSTGWGIVAAGANDNLWSTRWLSNTPDSNPGSYYYYNLNFTGGATISGAVVSFGSQMPSLAQLPTSFELLIDQGSGLQSLGTFNTSSRDLFCYDFGQEYTGVTQMQVRVQEAGNGITGGIAMNEVTALRVPEPATLSLLALSGLAMLKRRK